MCWSLLFVFSTSGCNFNSLKSSFLFLIASLYLLFSCARFLLVALKSSFISWQALVFFLLHGLFEVPLHLKRLYPLVLTFCSFLKSFSCFEIEIIVINVFDNFLCFVNSVSLVFIKMCVLRKNILKSSFLHC